MITCSPEPEGDSPVRDGHNASSVKEQPANRNAAAETRINPLKVATTRNHPLSYFPPIAKYCHLILLPRTDYGAHIEVGFKYPTCPKVMLQRFAPQRLAIVTA
jgi:hypothetical protein